MRLFPSDTLHICSSWKRLETTTSLDKWRIDSRSFRGKKSLFHPCCQERRGKETRVCTTRFPGTKHGANYEAQTTRNGQQGVTRQASFRSIDGANLGFIALNVAPRRD